MHGIVLLLERSSARVLPWFAKQKLSKYGELQPTA